MLRRIAEIMLGSLTVRRHLPREHGGGVIVASPRVGGLKYVLKGAGQWDRELLSMTARLVHNGDQVWDVGANVGLFAKAAAYRAGSEGQVVCIEADHDAVSLLHRSSKYRSAGHAEIVVLPVAVSRSVGFVKFAISIRARASNAIQGFGSTQTGGVSEVRTLPCVSLDVLLDHFPSPDMIKIDVEGAEFDVLSGASVILETIRPVIYCEVASEVNADVVSLLGRLNYRLWDGTCAIPANVASFPTSTGNIVAIPAEKLSEYSDFYA